MNKQLRPFILCDLFANPDSLSLRIGNNGCSVITCAFHLPSIRMWRYVLISRHSRTSLSVAFWAACCTPIHIGIIRFSSLHCFSARIEVPQINPVIFRRKIVTGRLVYFMVEIGISRCQLIDIVMMKHVSSPLSVYFIKTHDKRAVAQFLLSKGKKIRKKP